MRKMPSWYVARVSDKYLGEKSAASIPAVGDSTALMYVILWKVGIIPGPLVNQHSYHY